MWIVFSGFLCVTWLVQSVATKPRRSERGWRRPGTSTTPCSFWGNASLPSATIRPTGTVGRTCVRSNPPCVRFFIVNGPFLWSVWRAATSLSERASSPNSSRRCSAAKAKRRWSSTSTSAPPPTMRRSTWWSSLPLPNRLVGGGLMPWEDATWFAELKERLPFVTYRWCRWSRTSRWSLWHHVWSAAMANLWWGTGWSTARPWRATCRRRSCLTRRTRPTCLCCRRMYSCFSLMHEIHQNWCLKPVKSIFIF